MQRKINYRYGSINKYVHDLLINWPTVDNNKQLKSFVTTTACNKPKSSITAFLKIHLSKFMFREWLFSDIRSISGCHFIQKKNFLLQIRWHSLPHKVQCGCSFLIMKKLNTNLTLIWFLNDFNRGNNIFSFFFN